MRVYDLDSEILFEDSHELNIAADTIQRISTLPSISTDGRAYFVDARLLSSDGAELVSSLYWLSTEKDVLDWDASEWFVTPMKGYADLTGLARMPEVALTVEHTFAATPDDHEIYVTLANPSDKLAFFVELKVVGADSGRRAAPVLWSDNYVSLAPGETREVHGTIPAARARRRVADLPLLRDQCRWRIDDGRRRDQLLIAGTSYMGRRPWSELRPFLKDASPGLGMNHGDR